VTTDLPRQLFEERRRSHGSESVVEPDKLRSCRSLSELSLDASGFSPRPADCTSAGCQSNLSVLPTSGTTSHQEYDRSVHRTPRSRTRPVVIAHRVTVWQSHSNGEIS